MPPPIPCFVVFIENVLGQSLKAGIHIVGRVESNIFVDFKGFILRKKLFGVAIPGMRGKKSREEEEGLVGEFLWSSLQEVDGIFLVSCCCVDCDCLHCILSSGYRGVVCHCV